MLRLMLLAGLGAAATALFALILDMALAALGRLLSPHTA